MEFGSCCVRPEKAIALFEHSKVQENVVPIVSQFNCQEWQEILKLTGSSSNCVVGELSGNIRVCSSSALARPFIERCQSADLSLGLSAEIGNGSADQSSTTQFEEDPN
jgi:hypothetical protein